MSALTFEQHLGNLRRSLSTWRVDREPIRIQLEQDNLTETDRDHIQFRLDRIDDDVKESAKYALAYAESHAIDATPLRDFMAANGEGQVEAVLSLIERIRDHACNQPAAAASQAIQLSLYDLENLSRLAPDGPSGLSAEMNECYTKASYELLAEHLQQVQSFTDRDSWSSLHAWRFLCDVSQFLRECGAQTWPTKWRKLRAWLLRQNVDFEGLRREVVANRDRLLGVSQPLPSIPVLTNGDEVEESGKVAIRLSRLDLPMIVKSIEELYRAIESPPPEDWQAPDWLVEQYRKTTLGADVLRSITKPTQAWLIDVAATEVLNRLMPPWYHTKDDCPEVADSALDRRQKVILIELRRRILGTFAYGNALASNKSAAIGELDFLDRALKELRIEVATENGSDCFQCPGCRLTLAEAHRKLKEFACPSCGKFAFHSGLVEMTMSIGPPRLVQLRGSYWKPTAITSGAETEDACQRDSGPSDAPRVGRKTERRSKRSTERGEGQRKIIGFLTKHHDYANDGCINTEPIGNNALANAAGVSISTASQFFLKKFGGHAEYRAICRNPAKLINSLKALNGDFSPIDLYGRRPPDEDDRDDDSE